MDNPGALALPYKAALRQCTTDARGTTDGEGHKIRPSLTMTPLSIWRPHASGI